MNGPPSREEIDAKLETARMSSETFFARMDARCTKMEAAFEARCLRMEAAFEARCQRIEADMAAKFAALEARIDARLAAMYKAMIITAITSTLTVILGVGAINATVFTGMLSALDKGEELGAMHTKLGQRMVQQDAQFNQMVLKQREDFARLEVKQREHFALLEASLEARLAEEKAERARQRNRRAPGP